jgi:hypothetical protein
VEADDASIWAKRSGSMVSHDQRMDLTNAMAINLRRERHARELTQEELADRAGLSPFPVRMRSENPLSGASLSLAASDTQKLVGPGQDCEKTTLEISVNLFNRVINRPTEMLIQLCSRDAKWLWY